MSQARKGSIGPAEFAPPPPLDGPKPDLLPVFSTLLGAGELTAQQTTEAFEAMVSGRLHEAEIGALLALLATRTPGSDELLGAARVMRKHVDRVETTIDPERIVDTAGTGGAPKTFNVSTVAAVIAASVGPPHAYVAKHGNRSRTGRGSAEVLKALGVNVDADRKTQGRCLEEAGICFCFAIHHHPATRHVIGARKALGFATIFNILGPLTNPAGAKRQIMGVYAERFLRPVAEALAGLGSVRAMVIHSRDGLDELTVSATTRALHVERGGIREEEIVPESLGLAAAALADLQSKDLNDAAETFRAILEGRLEGPKFDMAVLNASATLLVADVVDSIEAGIERSREAIRSGDSAKTFERLIEVSNSA